MDEPRLDVYPMDYDDTNHLGNDEFFVSSGNRPFQFQAGDGKYVSQFFPGAKSGGTDESTGSGDTQQVQLGELRHTRDKLKLNLPMNQDLNSTVVQLNEEEDSGGEQRTNNDSDRKENSSESSISREDQSFRSVIRSEDSLEKKNEEESADEMSEIDGSKTETYPKSSGRPLVIAQLSEEETVTDTVDESKSNSNSNSNSNDSNHTVNQEILMKDTSLTKPSIENNDIRNSIKEETSDSEKIPA